MPPLYKIFLGLILLQGNLSFSQGKIIMNGATMKMLNSAYVVTDDVSLTSTSTINVDNSTIKIGHDINNSSGVFDVTNGTVEMNGSSAQTIPSASFYSNKIKNLTISNNVTLDGQDSVTNVLSFGNSNVDFATGGLLTLKSTAANTARVADITNSGTASGNTITGNVKIERYIEGFRAWRLLTAPTQSTGAQTINAAWQEGQTSGNALPGFGTHIIGGSIANGFDQGVNSNYSIKKYSSSGWIAVPNTNSTLITDQQGYMLFVRGSRSVILSQGVYAAPSATVLRSTGSLKTNNQSFPVAATGFTVIGNPYASAIDLNEIGKSNSTNIQDNFYLWDPKLTGSNAVGAFVNVSWNGDEYDVTPSPGGSNLNQYVQSGSAFLAKTLDGATPGTLVIKETDKYAGPSMNVNRPLLASRQTIRTNLYALNTDGTTSIVDGILNSYADMYSDNIDNYDAIKLPNLSENLSIRSSSQSLSVERKKNIGLMDTIFLNMSQMKAKSYKFEFVAENPSADNIVTGFLEDTYLNTSTPIDLNGTTNFNFNVVNVPGSWNPGRFRIVFRPLSALPITFNVIKAFQQNKDIRVEWKVENETGIRQYEIERSENGLKFFKTSITAPNSNNNNTSTYNWLDTRPFEGNNFYRIKIVNVNGDVSYSSIVNVFTGSGKQEIVLAGNIITNNTVTFNMVNMPAGRYEVRVVNSGGQLIQAKQITHGGGSSTEHIQLNNLLAKGIYMLEVVLPDNKKITNKIIL